MLWVCTVKPAKTRRLLSSILLVMAWAGGVRATEPEAAGGGAAACKVGDLQPEWTLSGRVSDSSGAGILDSVVTVECGAFRREAHSGPDGRYVMRVPAGVFDIRANAPSFEPVMRRAAIDNADTTVDVVLNVKGVRTAVDVSAQAGYLADDSTAGTKTSGSLMEVPQAITVVSRKLMNDQGAVKLDDALKNVAGVMPGGYYDGWDYYRIRGFDASFNTFLDGMRGGNGMSDETFGLEAVEVLKGPSSALYGQSVLGGLVNMRSKRPQPDSFLNVQFMGGSFGYWNPAVDFGGSLNRSRSLFGRVVALYRSQGSFVDYANLHRTYIAPSLTWRIGPATMVTFLARYDSQDGRQGYPLPAAGTVLPNPNGEIPVNRYVGVLGGNNNTGEERNRQIGYQFTHQFNDSLAFHSNFRYTTYRETWYKLMYPGFLSEDQRTLYRYPLDYDQNWQTYSEDSNLEANFKTGPVSHTILGGLDYFRTPRRFTGQSIDFNDTSQYLPLDLFNPVYGPVQFPALIPAYDGRSLMQFLGAYAQDQLKVTQKLTVTLGGRWNFAWNQDQPDPSHMDRAFTPRVGATYEFLPGLVAYGSYSRSFLPQTGRLYDATIANGTFAPPEKGRQWETGVKASLLGGRVSQTLALFDLRRSNILTADVSHPNFYVLTGQQRSRGVEFETSALLRPGWNLTAAYAFIDARVTEDNTIPIGTRTWNAPRHSVSVWSRYEVQRGWARGLGFGAGVRYYTDQAGDLNDTFRIPSYGLVDASVSYEWQHWRLQLNAYNLANARYFTGSYDNLYVKPGSPRSARVTVGWSF